MKIQYHLRILKIINFYSCTCSETSLFVTTDNHHSTIIEYRLLPSIELIKQWKFPNTCTKNEFISTIRYNNKKLGLIIQNSFKKILHIELRSLPTLDRLWSIPIDININPYQYGYCLLNNNDWLFINKNSSYILHITNNGKIKRSYIYNSKPSNAILF